MKTLTYIFLAMVLVGCASRGTIRTEVVEIKRPVLYVPRPPILDRPDLIIQELTPAQRDNPGTVAQYWKATTRQLLDYAEQLEAVVEKYDAIAQTLEDNEKFVDGQLEVEIK